MVNNEGKKFLDKYYDEFVIQSPSKIKRYLEETYKQFEAKD